MNLIRPFIPDFEPQLPANMGYETSPEWLKRKVSKITALIIANTTAVVSSIALAYFTPLFISVPLLGIAGISSYKLGNGKYVFRQISKIWKTYKHETNNTFAKDYKIRFGRRSHSCMEINAAIIISIQALAFMALGLPYAAIVPVSTYVLSNYVCKIIAYSNLTPPPPVQERAIKLSGKADREIMEFIKSASPLRYEEALKLDLSHTVLSEYSLFSIINRLFSQRYRLDQHEVNLQNAKGLTVNEMRLILKDFPQVAFDVTHCLTFEETVALRNEFPEANLICKRTGLLELFRKGINTDIEFLLEDGKIIKAHSFIFAAFGQPIPKSKVIEVKNIEPDLFKQILEEIYQSRLRPFWRSHLAATGIFDGFFKPDYIANLYNDKKYSDFTLKIKGQEFYVQKALLSSFSKFFKQIIEQGGDDENCLELEPDPLTAETLEAVLRYMYTYDLSLLKGIPNLFRTFDFLDIKPLPAIIAKYGADNKQINAQNVLAELGIAFREGNKQLQDKCNDYLEKAYGFRLTYDLDRNAFQKLIIKEMKKFDPSVLATQISSLREIDLDCNFIDMNEVRVINLIKKMGTVVLNGKQSMFLSTANRFSLPNVRWRGIRFRSWNNLDQKPEDNSLFKSLRAHSDLLEEVEADENVISLLPNNLTNLHSVSLSFDRKNAKKIKAIFRQNPNLSRVELFNGGRHLTPAEYADKIQSFQELLGRNPNLEYVFLGELEGVPLGALPLDVRILSRNLRNINLHAVFSKQTLTSLAECRVGKLSLGYLETQDLESLFENDNTLIEFSFLAREITQAAVENILKKSPCLKSFGLYFNGRFCNELTAEFRKEIQKKYPRVKMYISDVSEYL